MRKISRNCLIVKIRSCNARLDLKLECLLLWDTFLLGGGVLMDFACFFFGGGDDSLLAITSLRHGCVWETQKGAEPAMHASTLVDAQLVHIMAMVDRTYEWHVCMTADQLSVPIICNCREIAVLNRDVQNRKVRCRNHRKSPENQRTSRRENETMFWGAESELQRFRIFKLATFWDTKQTTCLSKNISYTLAHRVCMYIYIYIYGNINGNIYA